MNTINLHRVINFSGLTKRRILGSIIALSTLTACGSGGGAGDDDVTPPDNTAAMAVETVVGTWSLPDNWNGESNDEAYLLIRSPDITGVAEAIVYDYDDAATGLGQNCYFDGAEGTVSQSLSNELFLDISAFPEAVISLDASENLIIVYSDGTTTTTNRETTTLVATRLDITETDITPLCEL